MKRNYTLTRDEEDKRDRVLSNCDCCNKTIIDTYYLKCIYCKKIKCRNCFFKSCCVPNF